jgi:ribosome-associated protein
MDLASLRSSIRNSARIYFTKSGGPGGQNVNKVNSKVVVRVQISHIEGLTEEESNLARARLTKRMNSDGELIVSVDEERDQVRNRSIAFMRLESILISAARIPIQRKRTKPTIASRKRRLNSKKSHALIKLLRDSPKVDDDR